MKQLLLASLILLPSIMVAESLKEGTLTNVTQLTHDSTKYENPQWSPDGTKIAFTNFGYNNLYVVDSTGRNKKQISSDNGVGFGYEWNKDSQHIFATDIRYTNVSGKRLRNQALWSISISGQKERLTSDTKRMNQVTKIKSAQYKNSRNATKFQCVTFSCEPEGLLVVDAFGKKKLINEGASFCPSLSPNGKMVAFNHGNNVCVMNIDGTAKRVLSRGFNPVWANNSQIVFEQSTDNGHTYTSSELYLININGSGMKALTNTKDKIELCPSISPDGSKIAYVSFSDGQVYIADFK